MRSAFWIFRKIFFPAVALVMLPVGMAGAGPPADIPAAPVKAVRICPAAGPNCDVASLAEGLRGAQSGGIITLAPGIYTEAAVLRAFGVTLRAEPGAHIQNTAAEGKGALVIKGNDTIIEGLECSGITVPDRNGACIRLEGHNLTLRNVYFHDSEEGVLTAPQTGTVTIEDSRLERLGAGGRAHGLYIGESDALIIRRSRILSSREEGHEVKSRAARTLIEDSVIASLDGLDSRLIDVSNGGELIIRNSILEKGVNSVNNELIGFGFEGLKYPVNSVRVENSAIIIDHQGDRLIGGTVQASFPGTRVIGGNQADAAGATWVADRQAAGMMPYPSLSIH